MVIKIGNLKGKLMCQFEGDFFPIDDEIVYVIAAKKIFEELDEVNEDIVVKCKPEYNKYKEAFLEKINNKLSDTSFRKDMEAILINKNL